MAARARAELGAAGARSPQVRPSRAFDGLTPQELQTTQLILSPRTVAYHLCKAYPKLGIASRGELAALAR